PRNTRAGCCAAAHALCAPPPSTAPRRLAPPPSRAPARPPLQQAARPPPLPSTLCSYGLILENLSENGQAERPPETKELSATTFRRTHPPATFANTSSDLCG